MAEYVPPDRRIESLLQLCQISLDQETADFELRRFFQFTVWADDESGKATREVFERVMGLALDEFKANNCSQVEGVVWGPFEGSRFGSIFGRSNDEPSVPSFQERLRRIAEGVKSKLGPIGKGVRVLLIVGGVGIAIAGGPAAAAVLIHVPVVYVQGVAIAGTLVNASDSLRKLFENESKPSDVSGQKPAPLASPPPSAPSGALSQRQEPTIEMPPEDPESALAAEAARETSKRLQQLKDKAPRLPSTSNAAGETSTEAPKTDHKKPIDPSEP